MEEEDPFRDTAFLGLARRVTQDPYRLSLFAQHLRQDERPLGVLPVRGGTLVVTDRRLLEFRVHLDVHGAWNVKAFQGFSIGRDVPRSAIRQVVYEVTPSGAVQGSPVAEERIRITSADGDVVVIVSKGPERTLSEEDVSTLRGLILGPQRK